MSSNNYKILADEWVPFFLEQIKSGKKLVIEPQGNSMYPFLIDGRDSVVLELPNGSLKKGDVCLYRRDNGIYVLHRIHHKNKKGYYMLGDSQTWIEGPLKEEQIIAVVHTMIRKGKEIKRERFSYRLCYRLWMIVRPVRPFFIRCWLMIRRISGEEKREK